MNYVHISSLLYITHTAFIASHKICPKRRLFACTKASHSVTVLLQPYRNSRQSNSWKTFEMIPLNIFFHFLCHVSEAGVNFALLALSSVRKLSPIHPSQQHTKANSFRDTAPMFAWPQSVIFLSVETLKTLVYTAPSKIKRHFTNAFFYVCQTILNRTGTFERVWQSMTKHGPWLLWFRYRIFWQFVEKYDLKNNKKSKLLNGKRVQ